MSVPVFFTGLGLSLGLIVAIGPQNAFVLRQGLRGDHVLAIALTCALSDALLILLGITSLGWITAILPWLEPAMRYGGAAFLLWYALRSLLSAWRSDAALNVAEAGGSRLSTTLMTCLALTWLNPHVYLDTVVLLGTISTRFPEARTAFAAGAVTGSFLFFVTLGYGAAFLRPLFARPAAWRILDLVIAVVMSAIAIRLLIGG